jgi:hypothetical protein
MAGRAVSGSTDHVLKDRVHREGESPPDADTTYVVYTPVEWARAFPSEHIWKVRKASGVAS